MVGKSHSPILENASIITTSFCRNFFDLQNRQQKWTTRHWATTTS